MKKEISYSYRVDTISKLIAEKLDEFLKSIEPSEEFYFDKRESVNFRKEVQPTEFLGIYSV